MKYGGFAMSSIIGRTIFAGIMVGSLTAVAQSAVILADYPFTSGSANSVDTVTNATADPFVNHFSTAGYPTGGFAGTGSGFSATVGNVFARSYVTANTEATALAGTDTFFSFTIRAGSGFQLDLTELSFNYGNQNGNVFRGGNPFNFTSTFFVRSNVDGYATTLGTATRSTTANNSTTPELLTIALPGSYTALTGDVTFRFYITDNNDSGIDVHNMISRIDNVRLQGEVNLVPEPASLALLGGGALLLAARRRRQHH